MRTFYQASQMPQMPQVSKMTQEMYQKLFSDTNLGMVLKEKKREFSASSWLSTILARVPIFQLMGALEAAQDSTNDVLRRSMATRSPLHVIIMFPLFYAAATAGTKEMVLEKTYVDLVKLLGDKISSFDCMENKATFKEEFDLLVQCMFGHESMGDNPGVAHRVASLFDTESFKLRISLENFSIQTFLQALKTAGYEALGTAMNEAKAELLESKGGPRSAITLISTLKEKVVFQTPLKLVTDTDGQNFWECKLSDSILLPPQTYQALQAQDTAYLVDVVHKSPALGSVWIHRVRVPVAADLEQANCNVPETDISSKALYNVFIGGRIGPVQVDLVQVRLETKGFLNRLGAQAEQVQKVRFVAMGASKPKPSEYVLFFNKDVPLHLLFPELGLALTVRTDSSEPINLADLVPNPKKQGFSFPIDTNRTVGGNPVPVHFHMGPRPSTYSLYLTFLESLLTQQNLNVSVAQGLAALEEQAINSVKGAEVEAAADANAAEVIGVLTHERTGAAATSKPPADNHNDENDENDENDDDDDYDDEEDEDDDASMRLPAVSLNPQPVAAAPAQPVASSRYSLFPNHNDGQSSQQQPLQPYDDSAGADIEDQMIRILSTRTGLDVKSLFLTPSPFCPRGPKP